MCTLNVLDYDNYEIDKSDAISTTQATHSHVDANNTEILCTKCGCQKFRILLRNKNGYCKTCFLSMLTHKFRATLGKSKSVCQSDSILVAHSGKANSTVLTHLMKNNANESASKKLQFQYKILYIDDGMVKGRTVEERELVREALAKEAENLQLATYIVSLSRCITNDLSQGIQPIDASEMSMTCDDVLIRDTFNKLQNDTAKDELLQQLRRKLIVSAARKLNCNKIFVADTALDLAIKVLGDVSTGRGSQLFFNVGFFDTRCADVTLLRPLRDFSGEDVAGYLNCCDLVPIVTLSRYNHAFPTSIRSIAKDFINKLDVGFHSTVSTIHRTSEKLAKKIGEIDCANTKANNDIHTSCILCELTLDSYDSEEERLSVVQARTFSKLVSTSTNYSSNVDSDLKNELLENSNNLDEQTCRCNDTACAFSSTQSLEPEVVIEKYLCYSCRLIFLNSNQTFSMLPPFIFNKIYEELQMADLRREITDFLL
ncbi:cytosolic thiouridylase subunit 2 [Calliopsis andreniformis]|uniref:cytosolic thiouridylase subunit 2 n=1 Tax=Calliopsis andreniformis TaxID=337506 RepID=UPI003FCEBC2F